MTEKVIWEAFSSQQTLGNDVVLRLNDGSSVRANGALLAARAQALAALLSTSNEVDLSESGLELKALRFVLAHVHGALEVDPPRLEISRDLAELRAILRAADYAGAADCKRWAEQTLIDDHVSAMVPEDLRRLLEEAHAMHADRLFAAASYELEKKAPASVLRGISSVEVLAEFVLANRAKRERATFVMASAGKEIIIWDVVTGERLHTFEERDDDGDLVDVAEVAFSPSGGTLASRFDDGTVRIYNLATGKCVRTLEEHDQSITTIAFSPDGLTLASGCGDGIKLFDPATGVCRRTLEHEQMFSLAFAPDGTSLAAGSFANGTLKLWDPATGLCRHTLVGHFGSVSEVDFAADGTMLASRGGGIQRGKVRLWDVSTGACRLTLDYEDALHIAFSPDGSMLAVNFLASPGIKILDPMTGDCRRTLEGHTDNINAFRFAPDGATLVASCDDDGKIKLLDPLTGSCRRTLEGHSDGVYYLSCSRLRGHPD